MQCLCAPWQVAGGPEKYEDGNAWPIDRFLAERYTKGILYFLVLWKGYDHTYSTWEPLDSIQDKVMVRAWFLAMHSSTHLAQALHEMRSAVWASVWSKKSAETGVVVVVPTAAVGVIARALLSYLGSLAASTSGSRAKVHNETKRGRETQWLEVNSLEHIAMMLVGQHMRPGQAYGSLAVHKGSASNHNMLFVGPPFSIE